MKQDRQCTCHVTQRHVRATVVVVAKQDVLHEGSLTVRLPHEIK